MASKFAENYHFFCQKGQKSGFSLFFIKALILKILTKKVPKFFLLQNYAESDKPDANLFAYIVLKVCFQYTILSLINNSGALHFSIHKFVIFLRSPKHQAMLKHRMKYLIMVEGCLLEGERLLDQ